MSSSQLGSLIDSNEALESALNHVEQASTWFASPDPSLRGQGEQVFLSLRESQGALNIATFILGRSWDPFVVFQSLGVILHLLPSLSLSNPSAQIQSLSQLRDFVFQIAITRGLLSHSQSQATLSSKSNSHSGPFPQYLRIRFHQTFSALEKRCLGLEISQIAPGEESVVRSFIIKQMSSLGEKTVGLMRSNSDGMDPTLAHENVIAGLSIIRSLLNEFSLSSSTGGADSGSASGSSRSNDNVTSKQVQAASKVALSPFQHRWCKVSIQQYLLSEWLNTILSMLNDSLHRLSSSNLMDLEQRKVEDKTFEALISTLEKALNWNFILKSPEAGLFKDGSREEDSEIYHLLESEEQSSADNSSSKSILQSFQNRLIPESMSSLLLSKDLAMLLFSCYRYCIHLNTHSSSPTLHRLRQCLLLCVSLQVQDPVFNPQIYLQSLLTRNSTFLNVAETLIQEESQERTGLLVNRGNNLLFLIQLLQIFINSNSVLSFSLSLTLNSGPENVNSFFNSISQLSTTTFNLAFGRARNTDEEDDLKILSEELIDYVLDLWQALHLGIQRAISAEREGGSSTENGISSVPTEEKTSRLNALHHLSSLSIQQNIVPKYIESRLSNASAIILSGTDDVVSEIGSEVLSDQEEFKDQLTAFSLLARASIFESLQLLLERVQPLVAKMISVSQGNWQASPGDVGIEANKQLEILWEQIHWITLICGHVLADDPSGESPEIPIEIGQLRSLRENPAISIINQLGVTLWKHLINPYVNSPQVVQTILWFNSRWIPTYLLPSSISTDQDGFATAFGSQNGIDLLAFILEELMGTLSQWLADPDVVSQISNLLFSLTRSTNVMRSLLSRPEMDRLIRATVHGLDSLPSGTHGKVCESLVKCIYGSAKASVSESSSAQCQTPEYFFNLITSALESRLSSVIHLENFSQVAQRSDVISNLQNSLDMLEGLASSAQPYFSAIPVYDFISKFFPTLINLIQTYSSRIEIIIPIIKVFQTLTRSLELGFGCEVYMLKGLSSISYDLLNTIQSARMGDLLVPKDISQALDDDVPFEALGLTIELLNDLSQAKSEEEGEKEEEKDNWLSPTLTTDLASDVALFGFSTIVPLLISSEGGGPLDIPSIKRSFGDLSSGLVSLFPGRLIGLGLSCGSNQGGRQVFESVIKALILTLEADETSICLSALDSITPFTEAAFEISERARSSQISTELIQQALDHVLQTLLNSILFEPLDSALLDPHLQSIRIIILSRRSDPLGGQDSLLQSLHGFCLSSSMIPRRDPQMKTKSSSNSRSSLQTDSSPQNQVLSAEVASSRRHMLSQTVERLIGIVFEFPLVSIPNPRTDRIGYARASREESSVRNTYCRVGRGLIWSARAELRIR